MGAKEQNIQNLKFNKLTALEYVGDEQWLFECECGNKIIKKTGDVKRGKIKSCSRTCTTGNPSKHCLYHTWDGIKKRCYQINSTGYQNYGGRGIKMCDSWKNSFWSFVQDMGNKPSQKHTLERIDTNGNYCKENCIWATPKEQAQNRRNNLNVLYNNEHYNLYNLCRLLNLTHSTIYWRFKKSKLTLQEYCEKYIF